MSWFKDKHNNSNNTENINHYYVRLCRHCPAKWAYLYVRQLNYEREGKKIRIWNYSFVTISWLAQRYERLNRATAQWLLLLTSMWRERERERKQKWFLRKRDTLWERGRRENLLLFSIWFIFLTLDVKCKQQNKTKNWIAHGHLMIRRNVSHSRWIAHSLTRR